jgi:hypothetical protein
MTIGRGLAIPRRAFEDDLPVGSKSIGNFDLPCRAIHIAPVDLPCLTKTDMRLARSDDAAQETSHNVLAMIGQWWTGPGSMDDNNAAAPATAYLLSR